MVEPNVDTELVALDRQLARLRRKARRLQHGQQQGSPHWTAWSSTTDAAFRVVDGVMAIPAKGLVGFAIKLSAVNRRRIRTPYRRPRGTPSAWFELVRHGEADWGCGAVSDQRAWSG